MGWNAGEGVKLGTFYGLFGCIAWFEDPFISCYTGQALSWFRILEFCKLKLNERYTVIRIYNMLTVKHCDFFLIYLYKSSNFPSIYHCHWYNLLDWNKKSFLFNFYYWRTGIMNNAVTFEVTELQCRRKFHCKYLYHLWIYQ